jgi:1,4-dihydroxy-2-naphthoate octaprenyltransferase
VKPWLSAARPRTLPLALASIILGAFLAAARHGFSWSITLLCVLTATFLQILSNLANDYGDSVHGADSVERQGPKRAVQSGAITRTAMKQAMGLLALLSVISGVLLVWVAFGNSNPTLFWSFIGLGAVAIVAAITYTAGWRPYGYAGLGDMSVLVFFGWVGVLGTYFLQVQRWDWDIFLPATTVGLLSVAVLNVNNMRDIVSDKNAGKNSIPVRIGLQNAKIYHCVLLAIAIVCAFVFIILNYQSPLQFLFLFSLPVILQTGLTVYRTPSSQLDPFLRKTVMGTLLFVLTFGIGHLF